MVAKPRLRSVETQDEREFETFARWAMPFLRRSLWKFFKDREAELKDMEQEVLIRALLKWEELQHWPPSEQRAWLGRVSHNCCIDRFRRARAEAKALEDVLQDHEAFEQAEESREPAIWEFVTMADYEEAREHLTPKFRRALSLRDKGYTYAQITAVMQAESWSRKEEKLKPGTVGAWLSIARKELQERLKKLAETRRQERAR